MGDTIPALTMTEDAMLQVDETLDIAAPPEAVFAAWDDAAGLAAFLTGVRSVHAETLERMRWRVDIAGIDPVFYAVLLERLPGERLLWTSVDAITHHGLVDLAPLPCGGTRMTVRLAWTPRPLRPDEPVGIDLDELTVRCDLQRLKRRIESAHARDAQAAAPAAA
ncbi:SRPBCC family protein [Agrococcus sp. SL85]|uniref:SRPBCC family protein n=1 Tax=Agrococcus sp. SL85 TaxID=2995141 RepID=UPI00226D3771|nr:SRPBCC family protein [Agrococcus sp. SL85]WAC67254.1 SRPBCC family protein [Agrococcus sp. SL85]